MQRNILVRNIVKMMLEKKTPAVGHVARGRKKMDFLKKNMQKQETQEGNDTRLTEAENGWMKAKKAIDDAFHELGKTYFEANKENTASEFATQIETVNSRIKEEYLWHQYRLSLEGQRICDSCHCFITADSAFCNRCGAAVAPIDFSPIVDTTNIVQTAYLSNQGQRCPKCGTPLVAGALFCETCGTKIG